MKELLKKKSIKIALLLIAVAVIAIIVGMNVQSAQKEKEYHAHIEAAEKYLTELDYEQAIAEYTLALEIEPNAEEVLNGLEQTYLAYADALADAGEYEKAIQILNEGYAQTGRESLREKIVQIQEMQAQAEEEANLQVGMQQVFELMAAEDYENAYITAYSFEIYAYVISLPEKAYLYFPDGNTDMNGMGIGVYVISSRMAIYYGNFRGGMREGQGIYYYDHHGGRGLFSGEWSNDAPNGYGEEIFYMPEDNLLSEEDGRYITKGNLVNGLWDGVIQVEVPLWMGTSWNLSFTAQSGVPEDKTEDIISAEAEPYQGDAEVKEGWAELARSSPCYTYLFMKKNVNNVTHDGTYFANGYYLVSFKVEKGETIGINDFADDAVIVNSAKSRFW